MLSGHLVKTQLNHLVTIFNGVPLKSFYDFFFSLDNSWILFILFFLNLDFARRLAWIGNILVPLLRI